jgi:hypothetical protein
MPGALEYVPSGAVTPTPQAHPPGFGRQPAPVYPPLHPRAQAVLHALTAVGRNMGAPAGRFLSSVAQATTPTPALSPYLSGAATGLHTTLEYARRLQHALLGRRDPMTLSPSEQAAGGEGQAQQHWPGPGRTSGE